MSLSSISGTKPFHSPQSPFQDLTEKHCPNLKNQYAKAHFSPFHRVFSFCPTPAQVCFHVSPTGTERGNGSARRPFGSVQQALSEAEKQAGDVEIVLHGGVYRLRQPLKITQKTANSSKKLVLRSALGERAVLTGAQELSLKWAPAGNGIWKTHVRNALSMDRLLVNGTDRPMARYPNYDSTQTTFGGTAAACTDTAQYSPLEKSGHRLPARHAQGRLGLAPLPHNGSERRTAAT